MTDTGEPPVQGISLSAQFNYLWKRSTVMRSPSRALNVWRLFGVLIALGGLLTSTGWAQLGSGVPSDDDLLARRAIERLTNFVVDPPPPGTMLRPVQRVPRDRFGVVGPFPLGLGDLDALTYPAANAAERAAVLEGMEFFTRPHTVEEGAGPVANQPMCLGCHMSSAETVKDPRLVGGKPCPVGSTCVSIVSRAARSTPTNFRYTSLDPATGGGRAADHLDAITDTGKTAAFSIFADFSPSRNPPAGVQDPLDGAFVSPATGVAQQFGGFVQHTRSSLAACLSERIPPLSIDLNLAGTPDATGVFPSGFRRAAAERAGPPYIGRGLMEAVPTNDILAGEDAADALGAASSLNNPAVFGCPGDCVTGRHNVVPAAGGFVGGVGRFGLRANGVEILQFVQGGLQGELGFTSMLNRAEPNNADINIGRPGCVDAVPVEPAGVEVHGSTPFSERNFIRNIAPPEFGDKLLALLSSNNPSKPRNGNGREARVQRGAALFGIDLTAFANRMVPGRMPPGGDGRDPHAIQQSDRGVGCVGCHTPIHRTGQSPADVGGRHLSYVWAPIFSDLLLHSGPVINAERFASTPRDPLVINRPYLKRLLRGQDNFDDDLDDDHGRLYATFDLPRNLADDVFTGQKGGVSLGPEFRTAPLMGMGRMGPPYLHDARVYLSRLTVKTTPAGTVFTNSEVTNAPLVVRKLDDAIRAVIELHDLPAPDDAKTPDVPGAGCPAPPGGSIGEVGYGMFPADVICPSYDSPLSHTHRSEAKEVIRRFRSLSPEDQQALIEFLKEL